MCVGGVGTKRFFHYHPFSALLRKSFSQAPNSNDLPLPLVPQCNQCVEPFWIPAFIPSALYGIVVVFHFFSGLHTYVKLVGAQDTDLSNYACCSTTFKQSNELVGGWVTAVFVVSFLSL